MFDAGTIAILAPFLMVVGIVWVKSRAQLEEKRIAAGQARGDMAESRLVLGRVDELEDRVRILERIVTDGGYDLAQKIEALRDERGVEARLEPTAPRGRI